MDLSTKFASLRKQVATISLVTLVAGMFATGIATAQTASIFNDVPADAWFSSYVNDLATAGVIDSTKTSYRPGDLVNRAEMAKFAFQVSGLTLETATAAPFKDVPMGEWYTDYVYTLSKNGIVSGDKKEGVPTGYFRPQDSLNRAEATKMLINAAAVAEDLSGAPHFPDVVSSDWFYNFVETAFNAGVVSGYPDGNFRPGNTINRAEAAKMVYLSMNPVVAGFTLDSAAPSSKTKVDLIFSQNVDTTTAETLANYTVEDSSGSPLTVTAAAVSSADTVTLTTGTQTEGKVYYVVAKNVKSEAGDDLSNNDEVSFLGYGADVTGGALEVSLSTQTPVAGSIPNNATGVTFTCWDFTAGSDAAIVKSLRVHRVGPGSEAAFSNVYLYNGDARLTTGRSVNSETQMAEFNNINQTVAAGENMKLCLVADVIASGGVHAFELLSADDVMTNSSNLTGSFPLRGADQLITSASVGTTMVKKNGSLDDVTLGTTGARIAQFEIAAGSSEDQQLRRIALYVRGSARSTSLSNLQLFVEGNSTALASTDAVGAKDLATFALATPFKIARGQSKIFYVTADVAGARNGENFKLYVDQPTDVYVTGNTYGYGTLVTTSGDPNAAATNGYDGSENAGGTTIEYSYTNVKGSKFTIGFNGPVASDIAVNQKKAKCMALTITNAAGLDVQIKDWIVQLDATMVAGANDGLVDSSGTSNVANYSLIKMSELNDDGSIGTTLLGSNELNVAAGFNDATQQVTLRGNATIATGESKKVAIVFDVANNTNATFANDTIRCSLLAPTNTDQVKDSNNDSLTAADITPSSTTTGNVMSIVASSLTITKSSTPADNTNYVRGLTAGTLLAVQAKAGSSLDQSIRSLTVRGDNTTGADTTDIKDLVDSVGVYDSAGKLLSDLKSFPASGTGVNFADITFNNLNIPVAKNTSVSLFVKANVSNSLTSTKTSAFWLSATPLVMDQNGQTTTGVDLSAIDGTGTPATDKLLLNLGTATTIGTPVIASNNQPLIYTEAQKAVAYQFKLKASSGSANLQDLTVNLSSGNAVLPVDSVALYTADTDGACSTLLADYQSVISDTIPAGSTALSNGHVKFTSMNKTLVEAKDVYICVSLMAKTVASGQPVSLSSILLGDATATAPVAFVVFDKVQDLSGTAVTVTSVPAVAAATLAEYFFKGVPSLALRPTSEYPTTILGNGSREVLKFTAGTVGGAVSKLNQLVVTFEGSAPTNGAGNCSLYKGTTLLGTGTVVNASKYAYFSSLVTGYDWTPGSVYTVTCNYSGLATGDSTLAKLASSTFAGYTSAIVWNDDNGATISDAAFASVDNVVFYNEQKGPQLVYSY